MKRIGVVMNGKLSPGAAYADAHDFALHQFKNEADVAIDASSPSGLNDLRHALAE